MPVVFVRKLLRCLFFEILLQLKLLKKIHSCKNAMKFWIFFLCEEFSRIGQKGLKMKVSELTTNGPLRQQNTSVKTTSNSENIWFLQDFS